jgi:periplasmic divalent cation tolerance protein
MDTTLIAVMTTTESMTAAQKIARALVERKLAACVQVSEIESFFNWEGEAQNEREFRVLAKCTKARYPEVESAIRELHGYDLPAIVAFEFSDAYGPYAEWIAENSSASGSTGA